MTASAPAAARSRPRRGANRGTREGEAGRATEPDAIATPRVTNWVRLDAKRDKRGGAAERLVTCAGDGLQRNDTGRFPCAPRNRSTQSMNRAPARNVDASAAPAPKPHHVTRTSQRSGSCRESARLRRAPRRRRGRRCPPGCHWSSLQQDGATGPSRRRPNRDCPATDLATSISPSPPDGNPIQIIESIDADDNQSSEADGPTQRSDRQAEPIDADHRRRREPRRCQQRACGGERRARRERLIRPPVPPSPCVS